MKLKWTNSYIALYSLIIAIVLTAPIKFVSPSYVGISDIIWPSFWSALWIFLGWIYVRWVASTAEKAGRSYIGFMFVAIFFGWIAWLIVLMFKKPEPTPPTES